MQQKHDTQPLWSHINWGWILSSLSPPTLTNFFTRIEQNLISVNIPRRKTYSNLTLQENSALNNLKNNQSIVIKSSDQGTAICIMNKRDYLAKIHTYLQDRNTYKPLTYNPTPCTIIEYIHSKHIIDKAI